MDTFLHNKFSFVLTEWNFAGNPLQLEPIIVFKSNTDSLNYAESDKLLYLFNYFYHCDGLLGSAFTVELGSIFVNVLMECSVLVLNEYAEENLARLFLEHVEASINAVPNLILSFENFVKCICTYIEQQEHKIYTLESTLRQTFTYLTQSAISSIKNSNLEIYFIHNLLLCSKSICVCQPSATTFILFEIQNSTSIHNVQNTFLGSILSLSTIPSTIKSKYEYIYWDESEKNITMYGRSYYAYFLDDLVTRIYSFIAHLIYINYIVERLVFDLLSHYLKLQERNQPKKRSTLYLNESSLIDGLMLNLCNLFFKLNDIYSKTKFEFIDANGFKSLEYYTPLSENESLIKGGVSSCHSGTKLLFFTHKCLKMTMKCVFDRCEKLGEISNKSRFRHFFEFGMTKIAFSSIGAAETYRQFTAKTVEFIYSLLQSDPHCLIDLPEMFVKNIIKYYKIRSNLCIRECDINYDLNTIRMLIELMAVSDKITNFSMNYSCLRLLKTHLENLYDRTSWENYLNDQEKAHLIFRLVKLYVHSWSKEDHYIHAAKPVSRQLILKLLSDLLKYREYAAVYNELNSQSILTPTLSEFPSLIKFMYILFEDITQIIETLQEAIEEFDYEIGKKRMTEIENISNIMNTSISFIHISSEITQIGFLNEIVLDKLVTSFNQILLLLDQLKNTNICRLPSSIIFEPQVYSILCLYGFGDNKIKFREALGQNGLYTKDFIVKMKRGLFMHLERKMKAKINALFNSIQRHLPEDYSNAPEEFLDPIIGDLMKDPVNVPDVTFSMDKVALLKHLISNPTNPFNRQPLTLDMLKPNLELKHKIEEWLSQRKLVTAN